VDANIGRLGYVGVTAGGAFSPNTVITDSRQRWLFRMVHSQRPLQEKMALFWHNHFATGQEDPGAVGSTDATRMMAARPSRIPAAKGRIELFRRMRSATSAICSQVAQITMLVWLTVTNVRTRPQETSRAS
jgi:hypothetical protein